MKQKIDYPKLLRQTIYIINHLSNDDASNYSKAKRISDRMLYSKNIDIESNESYSSQSKKVENAFKAICIEEGYENDMYFDNEEETCEDCKTNMNECNCSEEGN